MNPATGELSLIELAAEVAAGFDRRRGELPDRRAVAGDEPLDRHARHDHWASLGILDFDREPPHRS